MNPIAAADHPEFAPDLAARAAMAVLKLLHDDPATMAYFGGRVFDAEVEELATSHDGRLPACAVIASELDVTTIANADTGELRLMVELLLLHAIPQGGSTSRSFLRPRIVAHLRRLLYQQQGGQLVDDLELDEFGRPKPITESMTRFGRVPLAIPYKAGAIATPIYLEFRSYENLATGQLA